MKQIKKLSILFVALIILIILNPLKVLGVNNDSNIYMLGDSRFVGMKDYDNSSNHFYYAEVGKGYKYLVETWNNMGNLPNENDYIVINFGVNDLGNIDKYIDFINQMQSETYAKIIVMTVNPVNETNEASHGYNIKNTTIDDFNRRISQETNSNIYIMDTNSFLTKNGFSSKDGIHFSSQTYENILDYCNSFIDNFEE